MTENDKKTPPPIVIQDHDLHTLFQSTAPLNISLYHNGLQKHLARTFVQRALYDIENSHSMQSLLHTLRETKSRMLESGLFKDIRYSVEPAKEAHNNAIVRFDVTESNGRKEIGIHTDMKGKPEIKISMANVFDNACTVAFECLPTKLSAGLTAVKSNIQWYNPFFGQSLYASWTQGSQDHGALHNLDRENFHDFAAGAHLGPSYNRNSISVSLKSSALQSSSPDITCSQMAHFHMTERRRMGVEIERTRNNLQFHNNPLLRQIYALPVSGFETRLRGGLYRVRSAVLQERSSVPTSTVNELRLEGFVASHHALHPLVTLGIWGKVGGFCPVSKADSEGAALYPHILDKFFLRASHVRGFTFVGPSIYNQQRYENITEYHGKINTSPFSTIQQLGSSMYAAFSSSLSFPVPLMGGLVAGHVFVNTGCAHDFASEISGVSWNNLATSFCTSAGGGLLLNQIPGIGAFPSGRLEFNFAFPLLGKYRCESMQASDPLMWSRKDVFQKMKFGLNWSSE